MRGIGGISLAAAALLLALATVLFGATAVDAIRVAGPAPAPPAASAPGAAPEEGPAGPGSRTPQVETASQAEGEAGRPPPEARPSGIYPRVSESELLEAVNQDLFQPDRTPPLERYQFPADRAPQPAAQERAQRRRGPELRVVGSAVMGDMALALVQVEDSIPLAVLLGESIEGYTLAAVDQESAILVGEDEILTLPVEPPLSTRGVGAGGAQIQVGPQTLEALQGRVQEMLRNQMMNQRIQMMERGVEFQTGRANPTGRGGRGRGGDGP